MPELPVHRVIFEPVWVEYFTLAAEIAPGAWSNPDPYHPATRPLRLYLCIVCYGLTVADFREGHHNHHRRNGDIAR